MKDFFDYVVSLKPQEVWYINYSMWGLFSFFLFTQNKNILGSIYIFSTISAYIIAKLLEKEFTY